MALEANIPEMFVRPVANPRSLRTSDGIQTVEMPRIQKSNKKQMGIKQIRCHAIKNARKPMEIKQIRCHAIKNARKTNGNQTNSMPRNQKCKKNKWKPNELDATQSKM